MKYECKILYISLLPRMFYSINTLKKIKHKERIAAVNFWPVIKYTSILHKLMRIDRNWKSGPKLYWFQVFHKNEVNLKVLSLMGSCVIREKNHDFTILEFLSRLSSTWCPEGKYTYIMHAMQYIKIKQDLDKIILNNKM